MTIKRQYILPNCSLILEGLSTDTSNVLSVLANAEFKIVGIEQSLSGGTDFFKALSTAISAYCQRLISGLDHPEHIASQTSLVAVEPDEGQYHRLIVKPTLLDNASAADDTAAKTIKLSTVQLFDMAEAIDQFYADTQTLPDVSVSLSPLSRKYVRAEEPLAKRAIPPLLGAGTLALTALGLFFLPVPELAEPEDPNRQTTSAPESVLEEPLQDESTTSSSNVITTPEVTEEADDETEPNEETATSGNSLITDPTQIAALQQQIQQQIGERLSNNTTFEQALRYQVSVAENGDIVGYTPSDAAALDNLDSTPLPELTYISVDETTAGSVAQFDVTFTPDGRVEVVSDQMVAPESVTPDLVEPSSEENEALPDEVNDDTSEQSSSSIDDSTRVIDSPSTTATNGQALALIATPIRDVDRIYELNQELRRTIINNRAPDRSGPEVRYRIRLDEDGNVIGYEASNSAAEQSAADLKIPSLVKAATGERPQLDFLVVVNDDNVVEVNPWDGWP